MINGSPNYPDLLQTYLPRPITSEAQYDQVVSQINNLIDKEELSSEEQEMLNLLGTLLTVYENEHYPDEHFTHRGIALVRALMDENELKQTDLLPIFKTKSIVSAVLNGKRRLTVEHINRLAAFFSLPHELFFEPLAKEKVFVLTA
jgi:HTH-type transcriptional regulator/antitoxin HigA